MINEYKNIPVQLVEDKEIQFASIEVDSEGNNPVILLSSVWYENHGHDESHVEALLAHEAAHYELGHLNVPYDPDMELEADLHASKQGSNIKGLLKAMMEVLYATQPSKTQAINLSRLMLRYSSLQKIAI